MEGTSTATTAETLEEAVETTSLIQTTAVAVPTEPAAPHEHAPLAEIDRDVKNHWQVCECSERLNVASHSLNEYDYCSVCSSEISDCGEGLFEVYTYNENEDIVRRTGYDADGSVSSEIVYIIEYDDDGNRESDQCYEDGVLCSERWYDQDSNGLRYESKCKEYFGDSIYVCEYNQYSDLTSRIRYDLEGNIEEKDHYERGYNEEGFPLWEKCYINDALIQEITSYKTVSDGEGVTMRFPEIIIDYHDDGTKTVTVNGDNGEVAKETYYHEDGTVDYELTYTYEADDNGNWTDIKVYEDERLIIHSEYALDEDGWSYEARVTEYDEDGGKTVYEYDENGMLIKETVYDSDGNEIE